MRPQLIKFGGHQDFHKYQDCFRSLYCDTEKPIRDVMNRLVIFDDNPDLDDCAHVCYGGTKGYAYDPARWDELRAERIGWIYTALTAPTKVHPDKDGCGRHKYLLVMPPDEGTEQLIEFYCVIVRVISKKAVAFITGYYIDRTTMDVYSNEMPRIYPKSPPKKRRSKK